jgi:hypothetical protein
MEDFPIYQLKLLLLGVDPTVWRRLLVSSDRTLKDFHRIIQCCMGLENSSMHGFKYRGKFFEIYDEEDEDPVYGMPAHLVTLASLSLDENVPLYHRHGFEAAHMIELEKRLDRQSHLEYPHCVGGERHKADLTACVSSSRTASSNRPLSIATETNRDKINEGPIRTFDINVVNERLRSLKI